MLSRGCYSRWLLNNYATENMEISNNGGIWETVATDGGSLAIIIERNKEDPTSIKDSWATIYQISP